MFKFIKNAVVVILLLVSIVLVFSSRYYSTVYEGSSLDEMLFYLNSGLEGADLSVIGDFFKEQGLFILIGIIVLFIPVFLLKSYKLKLIYAIIIFIVAVTFSYKTLGVNAYIKKLTEYSKLIEEEYVSPEKTALVFPKEKRNLIVLYLESMETTMMDQKNGGGWTHSVMPELEKIGLENTNFSNTSMLGGAQPTTGATWTVAGIVSSTSGLPLKIPVSGNKYTNENFLSGAVTMGDILKKEGYNLNFMFGSDSNFGGRKQYLKKHGDFEIFDLSTAIEKKYMKAEDKVFWGFEDNDLFNWAKKDLIRLANEDAPFNFNLLTVNTHFTDGWLEKGADQKQKSNYENVHAHSSKQIASFISWIQEQDFYDNTTIVLMGDHNSMKKVEYYDERIVSEDFERVTFNTFINAPVQAKKEKERDFSTIDMFPTLLASIGVQIPGERLGLGTNLFSSEKTLFEKHGVEKVNAELEMNSNFYNAKILKGDYVEMLESTKK